jgi:chromate reductase
MPSRAGRAEARRLIAYRHGVTTYDVVGVPGSLRARSYNRRLLEHAALVAPEGMAIEVADLVRLPLFDEDLEAEGDPPEVVAMKERLARADAVVLAFPEYNFGVAGVAKNLLDWASRPPGRGPLVGKPVLLVGASTSRVGGTLQAQAQLRVSLAILGAAVLPSPPVVIAEAASRFDDEGLVDETSNKVLRFALDRFLAWIPQVTGR